MQPSKSIPNEYAQQSSSAAKKTFYYSAPLRERFAYGGGVLLLTSGPVLAGIKMVTWMAIFMGINVGALAVCCVLAAWKNLRGSTRHKR
ncbi:MAG: hypothetical protein GXP10_00120 [Gammaproteobacteria bacterium]|nr:hypothetical protein [Gammaproteobacteria bacterium]